MHPVKGSPSTGPESMICCYHVRSVGAVKLGIRTNGAKQEQMNPKIKTRTKRAW